MLGIIAYGSLINPQETKKQVEQPTHTIPIKLKSFKRSFNQQPAWRDKLGAHSAVLNIQASEQNWLNAICFCYAKFDFKTLDNRERGYSRMSIPIDKINSYQGYNLPKLKDAFVYLGKKNYEDNGLLPNPDYLGICMAGAKNWGEDFYRDFLNTTHISNGILLSEYLLNYAGNRQ